VDSELDILKQLLEEGRGFTFQNFCYPNGSHPGEYGGEDTPEWMAWKTRTYNLVTRLTTENSPGFRLAEEGTKIGTRGNGPDKFERAKSTLLKGLEIVASSLGNDVYGELRAPKSKSSSPALSNRVFVVHGHDSGLKTDVEQFLWEIGLEPVVLHRQPDEGATLIEKFEKHSDVGYAFILLTPDEIAYTVDQQDLDDADRKKEFRARPNVIFEFGYFVGQLGRDRVCCLHKGDVVVPSDLDGLVYKRVEQSIDTQAYAIIRELKAAGYKINV
jgi:predicted nucleotide-binding protein